jgi:3-deoxy-D-manno-octulosonic-acid transferase
MLKLYRWLTFFLLPLALLIIFYRSIFNKEDRLRYKEKIFSSAFNSNRNYKKKLFWFHVASVGEFLSIIPLLKEIDKSHKDVDFLITSVTLSSSKLLEKKLGQNKNITHRFFPLDTEALSSSFINIWKPDFVFFVDSEIWPNFLFKIKERKIPLFLINGRITKKTFNRWKIFPNFAKKVFNNFDFCFPSSRESEKNLRKLKVKNINYIGNLKFSGKINTENLNEQDQKQLGKFKVWCAASTHEGEETIILKTHAEIKKNYNNILTIIIPRHINRVNRIKYLSNKHNLNSQILNDGDLINSNTEILIINSFGVLSKYFNYCKTIFIGKSFIKKLKRVGGQNPIEAAKSGCKIFHGPYIYNFQEVYNFLELHNISEKIEDEKQLSEKIIENFKNSKQINQERIDFLNIHGDEILKRTVKEINKMIQ